MSGADKGAYLMAGINRVREELWGDDVRVENGHLLFEGLTAMPLEDIRTIAMYLRLPTHKVQAVVWLSEVHRRSAADSESYPSAASSPVGEET
jgi:hypothetical protein